MRSIGISLKLNSHTDRKESTFCKHYGVFALGKSTIIERYAEFKGSSTNTDEVKCSGRPQWSVVPEIIKNFHKIALKGGKIKMHESVDTLKLSKGSVFTILHETLGMCMLLSKWTLRLFTSDQRSTIEVLLGTIQAKYTRLV